MAFCSSIARHLRLSCFSVRVWYTETFSPTAFNVELCAPHCKRPFFTFFAYLFYSFSCSLPRSLTLVLFLSPSLSLLLSFSCSLTLAVSLLLSRSLASSLRFRNEFKWVNVDKIPAGILHLHSIQKYEITFRDQKRTARKRADQNRDWRTLAFL